MREFDLPQRTFDFKSDLAYGKAGENLVESFLSSLEKGSFEVKNDRYRNGKMVVETQQNPRGARDEKGNQKWVNSGINVTTAKWWVYIFSPDEGFIIVDVQRLKRYIRANLETIERKEFGGADNPAKGFLLSPEQVSELMWSRKYDLPNGAQ